MTSRFSALAVAGAMALTMGVAACGDDDDADDSSSVGTEQPTDDTTDESTDDTTEETTDDTTEGATEETTDDTTGDDPVGTDDAGGMSDEALAAECAQFQQLFSMDMTALNDIQPGDEITDDHRDELGEVLGTLDGFDVQSDGARAMLEFYEDLFTDVMEADEFQEEFNEAEPPAEAIEFANSCSQVGPAETGGDREAQVPSASSESGS